MNYDEPVFLISVVSKQLNIHPQTLRQYEREGLIEPNRTCGKVRMYSQKDVDRIKMILRFTRDLGVNLAGVSIILELKSQISNYEELLMNQKKQKNALVKQNNKFDIIFYEDKDN
ncbi:heat shock protein transcriptional repressor HspR [Campylobacter sp. MG1]|uniref:heat shock protein transcriptional repressor HspR n=1 Tax=Campylobacter sp. MG1 TaxID=2976332 RepID=UPI00226CED0D|nr:helix-turn-helix transcriptional regulator [Campylobacter sp. MG1]